MSWCVLSAVRKHCIECPLRVVSVSLSPRRHKHAHRNYVSKRFDFIEKIPPKESNITCKSQKLMIYNNIIDHCHQGAYHLLPLGVRVLEKLIKIIDFELESIGAQKMLMPTLSPSNLWKKSGRWKTAGSELFRLKDRNDHDYCLGPTHEEMITELVARDSNQLSYKNLPMMLYQISTKFRDESWPKFGLLRGREFEMKDMYTFDRSEEEARKTYDKVCEVYQRIFDRLTVKYIKVKGSTGNIGGILSHEFHFPADVGEDTVKICQSCGFGANIEVLCKDTKMCPECNSELKQLTCIEVGHSFLLGTKYSEVFKATFREASTDNKPVVSLMQMGCYGLGVSRILQACVETLSTEDMIRWPQIIAPYQICIMAQKSGYKTDEMKNLADELSDELNEISNLRGEIIIDDRHHLSVGKRLYVAKRKGLPYVIVIGKKTVDDTPALYEVIDVTKDKTTFMEKHELLKLMAGIETVR